MYNIQFNSQSRDGASCWNSRATGNDHNTQIMAVILGVMAVIAGVMVLAVGSDDYDVTGKDAAAAAAAQ